MQNWKIPETPSVILVDLDNTVVNMTQAMAEYASRHSTKSINYFSSSHKVNDWHPEVKLSNAFHEEGFFLNMKPFDDAIDALNLLAEKHTIVIATSPRSDLFKTSAKEKTEWIRKHMPMIGNKPTRVIFCDDKTMLRGDFLIDDNPEITNGIFSETRTWEHVVFLQTYNTDMAMKKGMQVVFSWKQLHNELTSKKE